MLLDEDVADTKRQERLESAAAAKRVLQAFCPFSASRPQCGS